MKGLYGAYETWDDGGGLKEIAIVGALDAAGAYAQISFGVGFDASYTKNEGFGGSISAGYSFGEGNVGGSIGGSWSFVLGHDTSNMSDYRTESVSTGASVVGFDPETHFGGGLSVNVGWDRQSNSTMLTTSAFGAYGNPKGYGKLGASMTFDVSGLSNYDDWKYASHSFDLGGEVRFKIGKSGLYQSLSGGISYSKDKSNEDLWSVYLTSNTTKAGGFMGDSGSNTLGISLYANDNGEFNSSSYAMFTSYDENWYTSEEQAAQNFTNALTQGLVDAGDLNENAILNAYNENKLTAEQALFLIDQRNQANGYPAAPPFSNPNLLADPTTMGRRKDALEFGSLDYFNTKMDLGFELSDAEIAMYIAQDPEFAAQYTEMLRDSFNFDPITGKAIRTINFSKGATASVLAQSMLASNGGNIELYAQWLALNGGTLESLQQRINNGNVRFMEGFGWTNEGQAAYDQIRGIKNNEALLSTPIGGVPEPSNNGVAQSKPLGGIFSVLYEIGVGINNAFKDAKNEIRANSDNDAPWLIKLQDTVAIGALSIGEMLTPQGYSESDKFFAAMDFFPGLGKVTGAVLSMAAPFFKLGKKSGSAGDIFKNALLGEGDILSKNLAKEILEMPKNEYIQAANTVGSLVAGFELKHSLVGDSRLLADGLNYLNDLRRTAEGRKTLGQINMVAATYINDKDLSNLMKNYLLNVMELTGY